MSPVLRAFQLAAAAGGAAALLAGCFFAKPTDTKYYLLDYLPTPPKERLEKGLRDYRAMPFRLEPDGSKVIFNYRRDTWK